jgi:hypothetical protein
LGTPDNEQTQAFPYMAYFLRFIQFPNGTTPHPLAGKCIIELPPKFQTEEPVAVDVQIQGNNVTVLLNMFRLFVYDWKTGLAKAVCQYLLPFFDGSLIFSKEIQTEVHHRIFVHFRRSSFDHIQILFRYRFIPHSRCFPS